jgi:hypothetical protein
LDFDGDHAANPPNGGNGLALTATTPVTDPMVDDTNASLSTMATTNAGTGLKGFVFTAAHSNTKGPIKGEMDNIAGDTYFVKFSNSSSDTFTIH